ncbi:MAG: Uma2 family endonuclease [Chloroflexi bacterium]|nr:Uma2 family endonuclease [Chloroflexota bacterium]
MVVDLKIKPELVEIKDQNSRNGINGNGYHRLYTIALEKSYQPTRNGSHKIETSYQLPRKGSYEIKRSYQHPQPWPRDIEEAYQHHLGPYTVQNAITLIGEEPIELYNGWLVWQEMTNLKERRFAGNFQEILSSTARTYHFGQGYPDQVECMMANEKLLKPDVCVISNHRYDLYATLIQAESEHYVLKGSPELVIEIRSPSNRRSKERAKRKHYFENGGLVIWDVDPKRRKIWVYEVEDQRNAQEYREGDIINCERLFPGWQRTVADFFSKELTAEQVVGQAAKEWRAESRAEGKAEGRIEGRAEGEVETLRRVLIRQSHRRFGAENLPPDFEVRLERYSVEELNDLVDRITLSPTLEEWLDHFPPP